jgi:hypothetical protein
VYSIRRQQIEKHQHHVDHDHAVQKAAAREAEVGHGGRKAGERVQNAGDHHIHRRAGQRHPQLLLGIVGHPLQPCHPADGQERDVARDDSIAPRGQRVPELVQHHASKQRPHEQHPFDAGAHAVLLLPANQADPQQQQEERQVQVDRNAEQLANPQGPLHAGTIHPRGRRLNRPRVLNCARIP